MSREALLAEIGDQIIEAPGEHVLLWRYEDGQFVEPTQN